MKKAIAILAVLILIAANLKAQEDDLYCVGFKDTSSSTRKALLYKNNELLYSIVVSQKKITPYKVACDTKGNAYWLVVYSEDNSTEQTEIWKNDDLYVSTEEMSGYRITDLFCIGDSLFYVGNTTNDRGIRVATVWTGTDFTPHWVLGDGIHDSFIYKAAVDNSTNIPYCCGFVTDSLYRATVWEASQTLYTFVGTEYITSSVAEGISVENGVVYTLGYYNINFEGDSFYCPVIWKDGVIQISFTDMEIISRICAFQGDYYYVYQYPHGFEYWVLKNRNTEVMQLAFNESGVQSIRSGLNDIYAVGKWENKGAIWKNFELLAQYDNCDYIVDVTETMSTQMAYENIETATVSVYPNPANGILFVETRRVTSLPDLTEYRITNPMGQTLLQGNITAETQQINIENLPAGMYFITFADETQKFVVQ